MINISAAIEAKKNLILIVTFLNFFQAI